MLVSDCQSPPVITSRRMATSFLVPNNKASFWGIACFAYLELRHRKPAVVADFIARTMRATGPDAHPFMNPFLDLLTEDLACTGDATISSAALVVWQACDAVCDVE